MLSRKNNRITSCEKCNGSGRVWVGPTERDMCWTCKGLGHFPKKSGRLGPKPPKPQIVNSLGVKFDIIVGEEPNDTTTA